MAYDTVKLDITDGAARITLNRPDTLNAWNEWTEGSYLEPDSRTGDSHLKALARAVSERR